jgi:Sec-independent protein translocase protein TatA
MFRVGSGEFLVVVFVAMLFLGPNQIKALIKKWMEVLNMVRQTTQQLSDEVDSESSASSDK